jgi:hypothetical protein
MRRKLVFIIPILILILSACNRTNTTSPSLESYTPEHPPIPPDPFPIEMKCSIENKDQFATTSGILFNLIIKTNEETDQNVIVKYSIFKNSEDNTRQTELFSKEIYNQRIESGNERVIHETVKLDEVGRYRILFEGNYNGYGQQCQYVFDVTKNRIKEIIL